MRETAQELLEACEYTVMQAQDGEHALEVFKEHADTIDLVLLDLTMPRMGGRQTLAEFAAETGSDLTRLADDMATARTRLLAAREQRIRPGRDDKILTSWNGLMIRGMAIAGRHLGEKT